VLIYIAIISDVDGGRRSDASRESSGIDAPRQSVVSLDEMTESAYNLGLLELVFERCSKSNRKLMLNRESGRKGCLNGD
jgi:hypothetical protein